MRKTIISDLLHNPSGNESMTLLRKHTHELAYLNLDKETVSCECGYVEAADPSDIKQQHDLLKGMN